MSIIARVSSALDKILDRPQGQYGSLKDLSLINRMGHERRTELLQRLNIGDVSRMTVVDFGIDSSGFASVYPRLHGCARAIGMDISSSAIAASNKLIADRRPPYWTKFEAHQCDGMDLPLPDSSVDLFFSGESIGHVKFPPRYLTEIYRVLKPHGELVITTPNRDAARYKEQGEEYCTSPEHFWLFNYEELVAAVSEFFEIKEGYGFNGSFGSHEEDRTTKDKAIVRKWSRRFEREPHLATGVVLRLAKKPGVLARYEIADIPAERIIIEGSDTYLDLELGRKGLLLDRPGQRVVVRRPASDGVVCRFWCHRWSGLAAIDSVGGQDLLDLYAFAPGWRNWIARHKTEQHTDITIWPTLRKNPRAEAPQVLFCEAFTWRVTVAQPAAYSVSSERRAKRPLPGYGFTRYKPFVGTTVFHWFEPNADNSRGPWSPIGGRQTWTGKAEFWVEQIKQMMLANIDAIYLHCIAHSESGRIEFFKAYSQLRAQGYDVPKVAPFLDPFILFSGAPIDVSAKAGKDEFVRHYIRFFQQYFAQNSDPEASTFLLTIDGKLVLTTWWVCYLLQNIEALTREDVRIRLADSLGGMITQLATGIYVMTTALVDPDLSFSDERMVMFSGYAYAIHSVHQGVDVWHVQAGYWDQNIRKPGYFLPRDGGRNYRRAWEAVASLVPHPHRVYVESWNEYDEGSGIYAADPAAPFVDPAMHLNEDTFSETGDPYEYILTTADGAARINGRPGYDIKLLWHDAPRSAKAGETVKFTLTIRNEGNQRWATGEGYALFISGSESTAQSRVALEDVFDTEADCRFGVFRGAPATFPVEITAPLRTGLWELTIAMTRQGHMLGKKELIKIDIT